ncbi:MAG: type II and III secretion system protein family protein [Rickettsiales bacterium]
MTYPHPSLLHRATSYFATCALVCASALPATAATTQATSEFYDTLNRSSLDSGFTVEVNKGIPVRLKGAAVSVVVADSDIADVQVVSPRMIYVNGRNIGETSIMAVDANDKIILQGTVTVTHNLSKLRKAVAQMMPGANIDAASTDNAIILKGDVDSPVLAEKVNRLATSFLRGTGQSVINMMDTSQSDQVLLKVKIVEVARTELKRFGINWESLFSGPGNIVFGLGQGRDLVSDAGALLRNTTAGDNSLFIRNIAGGNSITAVVDALERDGLVSILAEPNLTARSGQAASFLAGGEIPIPVPGDDGTVTIEYRQFGVSLQFTPTVMSKDKINLAVLPEVSALSTENAITGGTFGTIPALTTRRANTTVDLGSGQTFAIAGLLRSDNANNINKFPILGDIPVLGALFRSSEFRNNQTELVILVTPYIVKPIDDPSTIATPLDGYTPPTDYERIVLGKLQGESPKLPTSEKAIRNAEAAPVDEAQQQDLPPAAPAAPTTPDAAFAGSRGQAGFLMR